MASKVESPNTERNRLPTKVSDALQARFDAHKIACASGIVPEQELVQIERGLVSAYAAEHPGVRFRDHVMLSKMLGTTIPQYNYRRTILFAHQTKGLLVRVGIPVAEVEAMIERTRPLLWDLIDNHKFPRSSVNRIQNEARKDFLAGVGSFEAALQKRCADFIASGGRGAWSVKTLAPQPQPIRVLPPAFAAAVERHVTDSLVALPESDRLHAERLARTGFDAVVRQALQPRPIPCTREHTSEPCPRCKSTGFIDLYAEANTEAIRAIPLDPPANGDDFFTQLDQFLFRAFVRFPDQVRSVEILIEALRAQWDQVARAGQAQRERMRAQMSPQVRALLTKYGVKTAALAEKAARKVIAATHPDRCPNDVEAAPKFNEARADLLIFQQYQQLTNRGQSC